MPQRSDYPHGTPSWVDLLTPDLAAAKAFYGGLFGWEHFPAGPAEQTGGYGFFTLGGKMVAGVMAIGDGGGGEGPPPVWTTYINVDDANDVAEKAREAGGTVTHGPMGVSEAGRMVVFADPAGAVCGAWQPGEHKGADVTNETGALTWNELATRDAEGSKTFYGAVFGWEGRRMDLAGGDYTTWHLPGETAGIGAGMIEMDERWPAEIPPHWEPYFATNDTDATVARCEELGGALHVPAFDTQVGRIAGLSDPQGAGFSVIRLAGQSG